MAGETLGRASSCKRAAARPHRGQGSGVPVRPLPRRRHRARAGDELDRRGDGHRPRLRHRLRQEPARRRRASCRAAAPCSSRSRTPTRRGSLAPVRLLAEHGLPDASPRAAPQRHLDRATASPPTRLTRCWRAGRISSTPSRTARSSSSSTPPRGRRRWPTAARCGAPPSCIKCRTTPLFPGAVAAAQGIKAYLGGDLEVRALQNYFAAAPGPAPDQEPAQPVRRQA